jgi:hypothetical protein
MIPGVGLCAEMLNNGFLTMEDTEADLNTKNTENTEKDIHFAISVEPDNPCTLRSPWFCEQKLGAGIT